jgi:hypothetical protein
VPGLFSFLPIFKNLPFLKKKIFRIPIFSGILLLCPLWTSRHQRVLFLAYALLALSASAGFLFQQQSQQINKSNQMMGEEEGFNPSGFPTFERHKRQKLVDDGGLSGNDTLGLGPPAAVPSFLQIDGLNNSNSGNGTGPVNNSSSSAIAGGKTASASSIETAPLAADRDLNNNTAQMANNETMRYRTIFNKYMTYKIPVE